MHALAYWHSDFCLWCHALSQRTDDSFQGRSRDLVCGEPDDRPTRQPCVEVFFAVEDESGGAIVAATAENVQTTLDFNQSPAFDMGEISPPSTLWVKLKLWRQRLAAKATPVKCEFCFELGRI